MKAIVHIGTEKTGTSSIQKYLYKNRRRLRGAGFHVLTSAGKGNNRALAAYCRSDDSPDDYFRDKGITTAEGRKQFRHDLMQRMRREIGGLPSSVHTVIISSEHFHSRCRTQDEMQRLRKVLDEFFTEVKIVCYIREQVATGESWYSTTLKARGTDSLVEFMMRCRPDNYYYNYDVCLGAWEKMYGFDALDVSVFDSKRFVNGDLLDDFTAKLDPALVGRLGKRIRVINESLSPAGQALARALNIAYPGAPTTPPELERVVVACKKMINRKLKGKGQGLDHDTRMIIFESFRESNERVRAKFFPDVDELFRPPEAASTAPAFPENEFRSTLKKIDKRLWRMGGKLSGLDMVEFHAALGAAVGDVIRGEATKTSRLQNRYVQFSDDDLHTLMLCAQRLGKSTDMAFKLMSIVTEINPDFPHAQRLLKHYASGDASSKRGDFMLVYKGTKEPETQEELESYSRGVIEWMSQLHSPHGMPLCHVNRCARLEPDGEPQEIAPTIESFSLIQADSFEEALEIAASCPSRAAQGTVEVLSTYSFLEPPEE